MVGITTVVFRWLSIEIFSNDHFDHVARARQVMLGDWPVRDFVDPGLPLMYLLSAAVQALIGSPLLAEALIFASGLAVAAALSFRAAALAAGSVTVALFAVMLQVGAYPRSYNYPKLLVYALAVTVGWWAVDRLSTARLAALAAITAASYYYRHDHGIYVGLGAVVLIAVHLWPLGARRVGRIVVAYAGLVLLLLLPHLAYVQYHSGLARYFAVGVDYGRAEAAINPGEAPLFGLDGGLANSLPFLFWLCWVMPLAGVVLLRHGEAATATRMRAEAPKIAMVIALAVAVNLGFVRSPVVSRLPDVAVPHTILGAWLLAALWRRSAAVRGRAAIRVALVACAALTAVSVDAAFGTREHVRRTGLWMSPGELVRRLHEVADDLREEAPELLPGTAQQLAPFLAYVRECTADDDRLLFVGYEPELFVIARRGFAGGHMMFFGQFNAAPQDQALTVQRLARESVPFVLMPSANHVAFRNVFGEVARYVDANYRPMTSIGGDGEAIDVLVERSRPPAASLHPPTGWPCFR